MAYDCSHGYTVCPYGHECCVCAQPYILHVSPVPVCSITAAYSKFTFLLTVSEMTFQVHSFYIVLSQEKMNTVVDILDTVVNLEYVNALHVRYLLFCMLTILANHWQGIALYELQYILITYGLCRRSDLRSL